MSALIALACALACAPKQQRPIVVQDTGAPSSSNGDVALQSGKSWPLRVRLPLRASLPTEVADFANGVELHLAPSAGCQGKATHRTAPWREQDVELKLWANCDHTLLVQLGRLAADGEALQQILLTNASATGAGQVVDAKARSAGVVVASVHEPEAPASPNDDGPINPTTSIVPESATASASGTETGTATATGTATGTVVNALPP